MMKKGKDRICDLQRFYELFDELMQITGIRKLESCDGNMVWPTRGVYFFMEKGEERNRSGKGSRVVRVGTLATKKSKKVSNRTLWNRLSEHRGRADLKNGNHRSSIFRLHVGKAIISSKDNNIECPTWGLSTQDAKKRFSDYRQREQCLEQLVCDHIGSMPFVWLKIEDEPGPDSERKVIEENSIALLSINHGLGDCPSKDWLGRNSSNGLVKSSGLWNHDHVKKCYDYSFFQTFEKLIDQMR